MDQQDKIAHLNELAQEHFNEGNLSAAMNAWQQVLELDAGNADAQRGLQLAKQKSGGGADDNPLGGGPFDEPAAADAGGGPFDADATMMFSPGGGASAPGGDFDADATMMFNPGDAGAAPAPGLGDDDGGATMMFNPGDAAAAAAPPGLGDDDGGATMMFNPGDAAAAAAPPPPAEPADADATMMFTPGALPDAPAAPAEPPDADATMMFTPGALPEAPPAAPPAGGMDFGLPAEPAAPAPPADQTMMSPDGGGLDLGASAPPPPAPPAADQTVMSPASGSFEAPPPPAPPAPPAPEPPSAGEADGGLEDFEMPSGGLEMAGPPDGGLGGISLPDAPPPPGAPASGDTGGGGGFSFDLPPAPPAAPDAGGGAAPGGDFAVPDLPSLGPPPPPMAGAPPPLAPPPPPPEAPDMGGGQPSGQFGEVDPGEIEDLAVPTVGSTEGEDEEELSDEERRRQEEEKAAEFAAMYGKESDAAAPVAGGDQALSMAPAESAIPWKLLIPLVLIIAIICSAVGAFLYLNKEETPEVIEVPRPQKVEIVKSPAEWKADYENLVGGCRAALDEGNLDEAVSQAAKAREAAAKAGLEATPELDALSETLEFEQAWEARFRQAVDFFCIEQYEDSIGLFTELGKTKADDARPEEYIGRIYYNLSVIELQALRPWDAVWPLEQVLKRTPADADAQGLKDFAVAFPRGSQLAGVYEYTSQVDPLQFRKAGCN